MDIEKILEMAIAQRAKERSESQMTLGEMVMTLKNLPEDAEVIGVAAECDSYRGYYSDLAFEPGKCTVGELLKVSEDAIGKTFEGYKGGDYTMTKITPVFCATYGSCGKKIISLTHEAGKVLVELEGDDF